MGLAGPASSSGVWLGLTLLFEVGFGRVVLGYPCERVAARVTGGEQSVNRSGALVIYLTFTQVEASVHLRPVGFLRSLG
jgi:hypothetical protein